MGEKIAKLGIKRDNDMMYYIKGGDVWATPRKKCLDGSGTNCVPFSDWIKAWTEIKG